MKFSLKIKAGALQYVLVIAVIIAIVIFSFISLIYVQQRINTKYSFAKETMINTQMGFDYIKTNTIAYHKATTLDFLDNPLATTTIVKKHWGIFDLAIVTSEIKKERFQKVGILGTQHKKKEALYLKENNQPLVVVGNTHIKGAVTLPKQGVRRGSISGISYYGNELISGTQKTSTTSLPPIKNIAYLNYFTKNYLENDVEIFELATHLKRHQSFSKTTILHKDTSQIILSKVTLSGNIVIVSETSIVVKSSAALEDVILIAPSIRIESNTKGNFQAIASTFIEVESNCELKYPSALLLLDQSEQETSTMQEEKELPQIKIANKNTIKGIVMYQSNNKATNYKTQISIAESAVITGEVYCSKNLEMLGSVHGTVYTDAFIVNKSGSIYNNHLYNGLINSELLPNQYAGLQINSDSNSVAKWVN